MFSLESDVTLWAYDCIAVSLNHQDINMKERCIIPILGPFYTFVYQTTV